MPSTMKKIDTAVDDAVDHAKEGSTRFANKALDTLSELADSLVSLRDRMRPAVSDWADQADDSARRGLAWARDGSYRLRDNAAEVGYQGVRYARRNPARTLLLAVAAGALVYAATQAISRRNDADSKPQD